MNLPASIKVIIKVVNLPSVSKSTKLSPLPNNSGIVNPKIPEIIKGINNLLNVDICLFRL